MEDVPKSPYPAGSNGARILRRAERLMIMLRLNAPLIVVKAEALLVLSGLIHVDSMDGLMAQVTTDDDADVKKPEVEKWRDHGGPDPRLN